MALSGVETPTMHWDGENLKENWRRFKQHAELMFSGPLKTKSEAEKCSYNPGQNIDDTFPNIVIFLAHCYYIEQTSPIPPPINVVLLFSFLTDSTLFWGRGGKLRGVF